MGQQQLLLLVLAAIIVGVAVIVGINIFGSSADEANREALIQDCLTIGARAQEWYRRPSILEGGNQSFANVTLDTLRWTTPNENGSFTIDGSAGSHSKQH